MNYDVHAAILALLEALQNRVDELESIHGFLTHLCTCCIRVKQSSVRTC